MKTVQTLGIALAIALAGGGGYAIHKYQAADSGTSTSGEVTSPDLVKFTSSGMNTGENTPPTNFPVQPVPDFINKGIQWLMGAQNEDGSWGAGSHNAQDVRDPHAVKADPATTAFCALALIRSGNTYTSGQYKNQLNKTLLWILKAVEETPSESPNITTLTGTQPQTKLGGQIDVSITAQFLTRSLDLLSHDPDLSDRTGEALQKCLKKIQTTQQADGGWARGGWAPTLQNAMAGSALEMAANKGIISDEDQSLKAARDYSKKSYDAPSGTFSAGDGAGVALYSTTTAQRGTAQQSYEAKKVIAKAKEEGKLDKEAEITVDNLVKAGIEQEKATELNSSYQANNASVAQLQSDAVLSGFGNNGGEEFLSYMLTSESMVITGEKEWSDWRSKMTDKLPKIQDNAGSWSGHHCITSPVFCTAAVIMVMTADRDHSYLVAKKSN